MTTSEGAEIAVRPANEGSWADLQLVFGTRGAGSRCWCQRYKLAPRESFGSVPSEERAHRLRQQTNCDHPESSATSGLVALLFGEPVGWCTVEPRPVSRAMARAAVDFARSRGAQALEAYPITTTRVIEEELHVGTVTTFAAAGLVEVSRPTVRRAVMRIDFQTSAGSTYRSGRRGELGGVAVRP
jgi:hypothetical protein